MNLFFKTAALVVLSLSALFAQSNNSFSTQGSKWLGGGLTFFSVGDEYNRVRILQASPILRFFPADHFMIGPSFSWTGMYYDSYAINQFGLGFEIGGVFNAGGQLFPYVMSGGQVVITGGEGSSTTGFKVPISGGLLIPLGNFFGLQIEPSFINTWVESGHYANSIGIKIGICAFGERAAISVLQGISGLGIW
jgi:hypothetical protein